MQALGGMRMVSIEQFAEGIGQMILSGHLGRVFDRISRKTAIMSVIPVNNLSIVLAAAMFIGLNATLTALDQLTNVISPIITGVLVTAWNLRVTCAIFGGFSLVSMASKSFFLRALYVRKPKLAHKDRKETNEKAKEIKSISSRVAAVLESIPDVLRTYVRQTVIAAAFGMALLFMTVMGFDGLAVGYGQSAGLPDYVLGAFRSYGSAMGIFGALSYAFFERRLGVRKTGLLGLTVRFVRSNSEGAYQQKLCEKLMRQSYTKYS
ncbi:Ferroportin1 [Cooperia oncophora]